MAVSDNRRLLSALESNWQAEMEGFHTYAALSEHEAEAVTERYQLDEPLQLPSGPQQYRRSQFGLSLETTAVMCWLTSISSFEVLGMAHCDI
jgi:hypothetical protein